MKFSDGIPERNAICGKIPNEYKKKKCSDCMRFGKRTHRKRERQEELDRLHEQDVEKRREELWKIYAEKEPMKLPIVFDGYGGIPMCPICGEMPYSTEQCHWCGQRFIQDKEVEEYEKPMIENGKCPKCGADIVIHISKYNGHRHFHCDKCGISVMQ